jgi:hypothetical protein
MKIIGGFICFLAIFGFSQAVTLNGILALLCGIVLMLIPELFEIFMRTQRFIHRDKK